MDGRRVLVTDGEQRAALAVVRSLGKAGHHVFACSQSGHSIGGASRYAEADGAVASPLDNPRQFAVDVAAIASTQRIDTIIPISEGSLLSLLPIRDQFPCVCIPFPDIETFQRICDKEAVLAAARRVGIAIPEQCVLYSAQDIRNLDLRAAQYPMVVKPARSVAENNERRVKTAVRHAATPEDLHAILSNAQPETFPLLLQQRVVGHGVGIFLLIADGDIAAVFSHRRIREKPPSGGVSVYRESIAADASLVQRSAALLAEFDWSGVAMVEFKVDTRTGIPYLMEINGRFWGSLQLAIDAGVDFPVLLLQTCSGQLSAPVTEYRTGVKLRWFWGEVDHLVTRLRSSDAALALPPGSPSRSAAIMDFFRHSPGDIYEIERADDMKPFLRESLDWLRQSGGK